MRWSGKEIKVLRGVIFPVLVGTRFNPSASETIHCTETLLCVENVVYLHLMAQYWYHTAAPIEYMQKYL
jgi:hypothetical protein